MVTEEQKTIEAPVATELVPISGATNDQSSTSRNASGLTEIRTEIQSVILRLRAARVKSGANQSVVFSNFVTGSTLSDDSTLISNINYNNFDFTSEDAQNTVVNAITESFNKILNEEKQKVNDDHKTEIKNLMEENDMLKDEKLSHETKIQEQKTELQNKKIENQNQKSEMRTLEAKIQEQKSELQDQRIIIENQNQRTEIEELMSRRILPENITGLNHITSESQMVGHIITKKVYRTLVLLILVIIVILVIVILGFHISG